MSAASALTIPVAAQAAGSGTSISVYLTSPSQKAVRGDVTLAASAKAARGIRWVEFIVDGKRLGKDYTAPYSSAVLSTLLPDGKHQLKVQASDNAGQTATSQAVTRIVDNVPDAPTASPTPTPTTTPSPAPTATGTPTPTATPTPTPTGSVAPAPVGADRYGMLAAPREGVFGSASFWRSDISRAPVAGLSSVIVSALAKQVADHNSGIASLNAYRYNTSVVTVPATQGRTTVKFNDCQHKGYTPRILYGTDGAFVNVPIPDDAVPALGTDSELAVYSPNTDQYWDFWRADHRLDGWYACWGGRIDHVSTNPGYFADGTGTAATGLALAGGMIGIREAEAGRIDHAVGIGIPNPTDYRTFSWPAQRSDGGSGSTSPVMEGQRLRLDPSLNVDALNVSPLVKMVARAAQKYGLVVTDRSGVVSMATESGAAVQAKLGSSPWADLISPRHSYDVLAGFPWDKLQALPKDYGQPNG